MEDLTLWTDQEFNNPFCKNRKEYLSKLLAQPWKDSITIDSLHLPELRLVNPSIETLIARAQEPPKDPTGKFPIEAVVKRPLARETIRKELEAEDRTEGVNERIRAARLNEEEVAKQREEIYQLVMRKRGAEGKGQREDGDRGWQVDGRGQQGEKDRQVEFNSLVDEVEKVKKENFLLRQRAEEKEAEVAALKEKLEVNERFWAGKVQSTDKNYTGLVAELQQAMNVIRQAQGAHKAIEEQYNRLKERSEVLESTLKETQERNREYVQRLDELMRRSGEQAKENEYLAATRQEMQDELNVNSGQLNELRRIVKNYEENLNRAHGDSMKEQEVYRARLEELNKRVRDFEVQNNELKGQLLKATEEKNSLVQDKVRWEATFEAKVQENEMEKLRRVDGLEKEWREKVDRLEISFAKTLAEKEEKFRTNMDGLEGEFKQVLVDANEKYKKTRLMCENLKAENVILYDSRMR